MPTLGADMAAGKLVEWLVQPGDTVKRGQVVAIVETDKGAVEVECWDDGVVDALVVAPVTEVPVGTVLATLREIGAPAVSDVEPDAAKPAPRLSDDRTPTDIGGATSAGVAHPAADATPALAASVDAAPRSVAATPAATHGSVATAPPGGAAPARVRATPAARRRAQALGIDLATIRASGADGAIALDDVERAAASATSTVDATRPAGTASAPSAGSIAVGATPKPATPAGRQAAMRDAIAAAMAKSKREIPHYYLGQWIDLSRATAWLAARNAGRPVTGRVLFAAALLTAVARALREVPELNGFWIDGGFRPSTPIHLGVGIALRGGGLVAPAIHDAGERSVDDTMRALSDLVQRARGGALRSSELTDATVTVTNLGDQGVETVFGVIYPPQVALVGLGKIVQRPWAEDGAVSVRPLIHATLAADHRASVGHRGALFLAALDRILQSPEDLP